jgi:hypothetical protein
MPQKENNVERRESFVLKQTYFSVNNDNAIAWKYTDLRSSVQCNSLKKWTTAWVWPSKAETCSNWCDFNAILN